MTNPLLTDDLLPRFDAIRPEHVAPAIRGLLAENRARLAAIAAETTPTFASVVEPMEEMSHRLQRAWSPVSHLNAVLNSAPLREQYNLCLPLLTDYQTDLAQSEPLYKAYVAVAEREAATLDPVQRRVVDHMLRDFRLAGVALEPARKERFKAVMLELTTLQSKFEENVLDATNAWSHHVTDPAELAGLNEGVVEQARRRAHEKRTEGWLLSLDQPTYVAVITDAESAALRRAYYEAWNTRASDQGPLAGRWNNTQVMDDILRLRHEAATVLGFANFADYALATRMAKSVPEVIDFLRELARAARPAAEREFAELEKFAGAKLDAWDLAYWSERLQRSRFSVSQEELRPYFPLPRVLAGLFGVAEQLFGVHIAERGGVTTWHPDARYFEITDARGAPVGSFYLDPYARPHKRSGAWMDDCVGRKVSASGVTNPVAYLVCNFLPPSGEQPALLTHDDVVTLFHEFGHGLHHMLTRVGYPSVAGINGVAWDAVELPSQFFENYAWNEQVLGAMAAHYATGAPLPADRQRQLIATRSFHAGLATMRQVEFSLFDFRVHAEYDPALGGRIAPILAEVRQEVGVVPVPAWNRFPHSFGHVFAGGYAAGYYSYKWAEVLAADAFAAFEEAGVFDRATAARFLDSILSRGGSRDPLEAFIEFRGRKPDIAPLLRQHGIAA
ncbi:MAG TPA: M3 family metallopeptidase [Steroidobacteraceae bacterium]|jgi:oligopeptidase A|nr:M3 family metallopeptidase [Steroidobacteraceae bacterium]HNS26753.1 M3 family metallopeptidase [Steroidobacteraceae bacterium]